MNFYFFTEKLIYKTAFQFFRKKEESVIFLLQARYEDET